MGAAARPSAKCSSCMQLRPHLRPHLHPPRLGSAARLGSALCDAARLGTAWLPSVLLCVARLGSARPPLGSALCTTLMGSSRLRAGMRFALFCSELRCFALCCACLYLDRSSLRYCAVLLSVPRCCSAQHGSARVNLGSARLGIVVRQVGKPGQSGQSYSARLCSARLCVSSAFAFAFLRCLALPCLALARLSALSSSPHRRCSGLLGSALRCGILFLLRSALLCCAVLCAVLGLAWLARLSSNLF
jgi:hypothetical protein